MHEFYAPRPGIYRRSINIPGGACTRVRRRATQSESAALYRSSTGSARLHGPPKGDCLPGGPCMHLSPARSIKFSCPVRPLITYFEFRNRSRFQREARTRTSTVKKKPISAGRGPTVSRGRSPFAKTADISNVPKAKIDLLRSDKFTLSRHLSSYLRLRQCNSFPSAE